MPKAVIIIISYNSYEETIKPCIESLYRCNSKVQFETIIVDNGSDLDTVGKLKSLDNELADLTIIYNPVNAGFAGGNNIGLRARISDFYILLNNDTIVTDYWLDRLIAFLEHHGDVGIVGPTTNFAGSEQRIFLNSSGQADIIQEGLHWAHECDGDFFFTNMISFFCVAIKKHVIDSVGLLDESFGVGMFEDTDYCLRVLQNNFKIAVLEDVFVFHKGSQSFNKIFNLNDLFYQNLLKFEAKHGIRWQPEHNNYLQLILRYIHQVETNDETIYKLNFKIANKIKMLEQLNCSAIFRNYVDLQTKECAVEELSAVNNSAVWKVAKRLQSISHKSPFRYPIHAIYYRKTPGIKAYFKIIGQKTSSFLRRTKECFYVINLFNNYVRQSRFIYVGRSLEIVKQHGFKELARRIKQKMRKSKPLMDCNPYLQLNLLKEIDIQVINRDYSDRALETPFSIVTTVKNESGNIIDYLSSLEGQLLKPDEIVIVDGGSTDDTIVLIKSYCKQSSLKINLIEGNNLNIAQGRNMGVKNAVNDIIVFTDAGCRVDRNFCQNLIGPLTEDSSVDLVGGVYHPLEHSQWAKELIPDWNSEDMNWWRSFLPSARSQAIRRSLFFKCSGFPEYLTLTGEDTLFDINYRRISHKWVYNKQAFVYWNAPMTQYQALKLWTSYGIGNEKNCIGDFDFYDHWIEYKKNGFIQNGTPMGSFIEGYILGRENRSKIEIDRRKIQGIFLVLTDKSITNLKSYNRLFKEYRMHIEKNYKIIYVCAGPAKQNKQFLDIDYSMLELYLKSHFDINEFVDRYRNILDMVVIYRDTQNAELINVEHKIITLQRKGYHKLNTDTNIVATVFKDFPLKDIRKNKSEQEKQIIEHYRNWFPIEKNQGIFFAKLIIDKLPDWLHYDILKNKLSILDFGCSCGHLVNLLSTRYRESKISGIDIELVRINKAYEYYPFNSFKCEDIRKIPDKFDCIFTSNVLEHFEKPLDVINECSLNISINIL